MVSCVCNAAVRSVLVGAEDPASNDIVYAPRKPRVSTSYRILHLQARMYVSQCYATPTVGGGCIMHASCPSVCLSLS